MTSIFVMLYINCGSLLCEYAGAPHAGARIEITPNELTKQNLYDAPHAGARIEIVPVEVCAVFPRRPPRGGEN